MTSHFRIFAMMMLVVAVLVAGAVGAAEPSPLIVPVTDPFTQALTATYQNNPKILAERKRQESTDESVAQAVSGFRPSLGATYNGGKQRTAFNGASWSNDAFSTKELRLEQPLFKGGGTFASYESAKQRVTAGAFQLSAVEQQILLRGIRAYMDVVQGVAALKLAHENEDALNKQLQASEDKFAVGEVTRTDVAQSQSRLLGAKTRVINAEGDLLDAIATFERIVGYKPSGALPSPENIPELPATLQEAQVMAHVANPQLLSAIHAAKSSDYDVRINESVLLPRVSLVGSMSRQTGIGLLGSDKFNQDQIGVQVTIPLYESGAEYSKIREAKGIARQKSNEAMDTELSVDESVMQSWQALETATGAIAMREDQIKAAQTALDGVRQEQQYGTRTVLDVLDAEQELYAAKNNLVSAQHDRVLAAYSLLLSLGRLTPENLSLPVKSYDASVHLDDVKWLPIGF